MINAPTPTPTPTPTPPPLITMESVQVESIKSRAGKKAKKEDMLVLQFSGALNATAADNAGEYELAPIIKVKGLGQGQKPKAGNDPARLTRDTGLRSLHRLVQPGHAHSPGQVSPRKPEELIVIGSLVTDALGRPIDGVDDGQPGSSYIATIGGSQALAGGLPLARTGMRRADVPAAIDVLLVRGDLTEAR